MASQDLAMELVSQLSDVELFRRLLMIRKKSRVLPLCADGLESFLWLERHEALKHFSLGSGKKLTAARRLATVLARTQVDQSDPLADAEALVRYLFLEHTDADSEVTGALTVDTGGGWQQLTVFHRGNLGLGKIDLRSVLAAAIREQGAVLLFHLRPGGDAQPDTAEKELAHRTAHAANLAGVGFSTHG
jgi:DNA repair protein RadC